MSSWLCQKAYLGSLPWACWFLSPLSMKPHLRIACCDSSLVVSVGIQKFVVICTKVNYQWHFIKCVRKPLLLLPVNVVCITFSLVKTVLILMLHAKNTGQPWGSWSFGQMIHGQWIGFPGEYMNNKWKLDFTLPLVWLYSLLVSHLLPFTVHLCCYWLFIS
jgi:hypothetical protein